MLDCAHFPKFSSIHFKCLFIVVHNYVDFSKNKIYSNILVLRVKQRSLRDTRWNSERWCQARRDLTKVYVRHFLCMLFFESQTDSKEHTDRGLHERVLFESPLRPRCIIKDFVGEFGDSDKSEKRIKEQEYIEMLLEKLVASLFFDPTSSRLNVAHIDQWLM